VDEMTQSTDFQTELNTSVKHKLGLTQNIVIDSMSDNVMIAVNDAAVTSINNAGEVTQALKITEVVALDLTKVTKAQLAGMVASLMLDNIRALKPADGIDDAGMKRLNAEHIAGRFLNEIVPTIQGKISLSDSVNYVVAESFNFAKYGLNADWFASGNKSTYALPKNGGIKVYLRPEFKREFDDLCDKGLLSEDYGRNMVKEGEFAGFFAVVIPATSDK
jgi:hypothetical protein